MIRRYNEIMESAIANMIALQNKITDFNEGSVIHTFLDTVARLVERAYVAIRQGYNEQLKILPYSPFNMSKKGGLYTSGTVIFSRDKPLDTKTIIPKGTKVSGGGYSYTTTASCFIAAGKIDSDAVSVIADLQGSASNIAAGSIQSIDSVLPADVVTVRNDNIFTGGTDEETDTDFEERFKAYINGLSGTNTYAIKSAALNIEGVRSVAIQNHKPPLNNVYNLSIYVEDGSGNASSEILGKVEKVIVGDGTEENQGHLAPAVNIRVLAPTAQYINVEMNIVLTSNADAVNAEKEIETTITSFINNKTIGQAVYLSELIAEIMSLGYIADCSIITPTENIEPNISGIVRLSKCTLTISVEV